MSYTKKLARYGAELRYEDIPAEVLQRAKLLTLQTLGVALAAVNSETGASAVALGKKLGSAANEATIWGDGSRINMQTACLVNGTLSDTLDWEDCSWTGHPSACAVSAGITLGEQRHESGRTYLLSLVTAYELYERIAMAVQPSMTTDGWLTKGWGLSSWPIFAAAVAAGKMMKLNSVQMEDLIGISGALTPIVNAKVHVSRSNFYHFQWGFNSANGVMGAQLAQIGINPLADFLDGENGYWATLTDECRWEWYDKNLGSQWMIMETLMKHWPANMWVQQPLDAMDALIREHGLKPEDIKAISVSPEIQSRFQVWNEGYTQQVAAQFSIPYCLAAMLHHPAPTMEWFSEKNRMDPAIIALSAKVKPVGDVYYRLQDCFDMFQKGTYPYFTVTVECNDGRIVSTDVPLPKGHPGNMMTEEEFAERFMLATEAVLKPDQASRIVDMVMNLDSLEDVGMLVNAMNFKK